jgi:hypothetical protein
LNGPSSWVANSSASTDDGANKNVTISTTGGPKFFRLRKP